MPQISQVPFNRKQDRIVIEQSMTIGPVLSFFFSFV